MDHLVLHAEKFLLHSLMNGQEAVTKQNKISHFLYGASGLLVFIAVLFFGYAAHLWIADHYGMDAAIAALGVSALVLALICAFVAYALAWYRRKRIKALQDDVSDMLQAGLEMADEELSEYVRQNPKMATVIASLAGYVTGNQLL